MILLSEGVKSWSRSVLMLAGLAVAGCGGVEVDASTAPGAEATPATHRAAGYADGTCDGPNLCPVSTWYVDCGQGRPYAYAWQTTDGGYCIESDACGRNTQICAFTAH